jgi:hypothetical protein
MVVLLACSVGQPAVAADTPRSHLEPAGGVGGGPKTFASLGLKLTRASVVLRQQLALKRGAGLVVDDVAAGSRAARAGFAQHDVLVRLDDQLLVLPEQFDVLLESAEQDAPLECTVLRGGRQVAIPLGRGAVAGVQPPRTTLSTGQLRPTASSLALVQPPASKQGPIEAAPLRRLADETLVRQDADYLIRLTNGDETRLMVSDPQGRVVFNAAIDTPEGRSRMPVSVRDRVDEMERMLEGHGQPSGTAATAAAPKAAPQVEVGRLDVSPVELR